MVAEDAGVNHPLNEADVDERVVTLIHGAYQQARQRSFHFGSNSLTVERRNACLAWELVQPQIQLWYVGVGTFCRLLYLLGFEAMT